MAPSHEASLQPNGVLKVVGFRKKTLKFGPIVLLSLVLRQWRTFDCNNGAGSAVDGIIYPG